MNEKTLAMLEFPAIREALAARAHSSLGRELALNLTPSPHLDEVQSLQEETRAAVSLLLREGSVPLDGIHDLRPALQKAARGGTLTPPEFTGLLSTLRTLRRLRAFLLGEHARDLCLAAYGERLPLLPDLEAALGQALEEDGTLRPDASPTLARLHRQRLQEENRLQEELTTLLHGQYSKYLQEPLITLRSGRYVLPVKQEYRHQVPGLIHDQSASGATLFIEPLAVVELNNSLRRLEAAITAEEERILAELSAQIGAQAAPLTAALETLGHLDCLFAKAQLSLDYHCHPPELNTEGRYRLRQARHPLLQGEVVPIDLELGKDFTSLVITGPNTGGKTVSLKTLGLLTLMAQAGLEIPAAAGSEICVATEIYADIGDEQSISQNLSTFSAHMRNLVQIVTAVKRAAGSSSRPKPEKPQEGQEEQEPYPPTTAEQPTDTRRLLVLLDEIGAGTDPAEGAALAMSILDFLKSHGVRVLATTHYSELKAYAYLTPGVANASMEFDLATLSPTYHLQIGVPGQSNAFAIASRLGLPREFIEQAKARLGGQALRVEEMIAEIERDRKEAQANRQATARARQDAEKLRAELARAQAELNKRRRQLLAEATEEAETLLHEARLETDRLVGEIRAQLRALETAREKMEAAIRRQDHERKTEARGEAGETVVNPCETPAGVDPAEIEAALAARRATLTATEAKIKAKKATLAAGPPQVRPEQRKQPTFLAGQRVYLTRLDLEGTILAPPERDATEVQVQVGIMKLKVPLDDLTPLSSPRPHDLTVPGTQCLRQPGHDPKTIRTELDLRGLTSEEALERIQKYLDDAFLANLKTIRLIHGKGTGVLRQSIRAFLREHPQVASFRAGAYNEGGDGVTVVELK